MDRAVVKAVSVDFGSSGTNITQAAPTTATSNVVHLPRDEYTVQVVSWTTGTSIHGATVVWQATNGIDESGWFPLGTAAALSTNAGAGTSANGAGLAVTAKYAYGRAVVVSTGTGNAEVYLGI